MARFQSQTFSGKNIEGETIRTFSCFVQQKSGRDKKMRWGTHFPLYGKGGALSLALGRIAEWGKNLFYP